MLTDFHLGMIPKLNAKSCFAQILAKAAEALAQGDVINRRIRQHQNWALMPFGAVLSAVYPASYMRGSRFNFG